MRIQTVVIVSFFLGGFGAGTSLAAPKKTIPPLLEGVEWWRTEKECTDATNFVEYVPRTSSKAPIPKGLIPDGLPHRACIATTLPEIDVSIGWVRQPEGAEYLFKKETDGTMTPVLVSKCLNKVWGYVYLPDPKGDKGDPGLDGKDGKEVTDEHLRELITPIVKDSVTQVTPTDEHLKDLIKRQTTEDIGKKVTSEFPNSSNSVNTRTQNNTTATSDNHKSKKKVWIGVGAAVVVGTAFGGYELSHSRGNQPQPPVYAAGSVAIGGK